MDFTKIVDGIIEREGGDKFVDNPADHGGPTRWGITEKTARRYGYAGAMQDLPRDFAAKIYFEGYIQEPGFDRVADLSEQIAVELIDTNVNMRYGLAGQFLQRVLNVLNRQARLWADLKVDGQVGNVTLGALAAALARPGHTKQQNEHVILIGFDALRGAEYIAIAERDPTQEQFIFGWLRTRVMIANDAAGPGA